MPVHTFSNIQLSNGVSCYDVELVPTAMPARFYMVPTMTGVTYGFHVYRQPGAHHGRQVPLCLPLNNIVIDSLRLGRRRIVYSVTRHIHSKMSDVTINLTSCRTLIVELESSTLYGRVWDAEFWKHAPYEDFDHMFCHRSKHFGVAQVM